MTPNTRRPLSGRSPCLRPAFLLQGRRGFRLRRLQIERKQINLGIDSLGKIAGVLECKICELLEEPAQGEQPPADLRPGRRGYLANRIASSESFLP